MPSAGNWPSLGSKSVRLSLEHVLLPPGAFLQVISQRLFALRRLEAQRGSRNNVLLPLGQHSLPHGSSELLRGGSSLWGVVAGGTGSLTREASGGQGVHSACASPRLRPVALNCLRASAW